MVENRYEPSIFGNETIRRWAHQEVDQAIARMMDGESDGLSEISPMAVQIIMHEEQLSMGRQQMQAIDQLRECLGPNRRRSRHLGDRAAVVVEQGGPWAVAAGLLSVAAVLLKMVL